MVDRGVSEVEVFQHVFFTTMAIALLDFLMDLFSLTRQYAQ